MLTCCAGDDPTDRCIGGQFSLCSGGYEGSFCASCADNYYKDGGMRGSCIKCPDPPPPVRLAIGLMILAFNLLVTFGTPVIVGTVMDIVGDLQMFRGIGMMAVVTNQEIQAFYNQLALLTLDFSYERAQLVPGRSPALCSF